LITIERLPEEEFYLLKDIEEGFTPDPQQSIAVVAKQDGRIIGRMLLVGMAHIEGTWIADDFRNGTIAVRMIREMEKQATETGLKTIFAYSDRPEIDEYMERLGYASTNMKVFRKDL